MLSLVLFLLAVGIVALAASRFQPDVWHERLIKPSWNPPNWVFAPVWSILYLLISIAGWLIWLKTERPFNPALVVWIFQLTLNGFWTYWFFGRRRPDLALLDILVLLVAILLFIVFAIGTSPLAAFLFIPYLLWIAFAAALNFRILQLNRMR
jgi:benzodiazapine receptor